MGIQNSPTTCKRFIWPRLIDWITALAYPAVAIGAYVGVQIAFLKRDFYWTDWRFLAFALGVPALCIALMAFKSLDIMARRVFVPMLAVAAFVAGFWVCHPALRF